MPAKWSAKDERQYTHVLASAKDDGKSAKRAKQIAARVVNKQRRTEGRTSNTTSQGTGNPNKSLIQRTRTELYNQARQRRIVGRSRMTKAELIDALRT